MLKKKNDNVSHGENETEFLKISLVNQGISTKRNRADPLQSVKESDIDYKNLELLIKYLSERGKIAPSRISNISLKKQKRLAIAIKRARNLALLSFIAKPEE